MRVATSLGVFGFRTLLATAFAILWAASAQAQTEAPDSSGTANPELQVSGFAGSFTEAIPIVVPPFHGLEPNLALTYDSGRWNGTVGVGWRLDGLSKIERSRARGGSPLYDTTDVFFLDSDELIVCGSISSPSCTGVSPAADYFAT